MNSIAYLAIIHTLLQAGPPPFSEQERILDSILKFIISFDSIQIRYVGSMLAALLERIAAGNLFPVCKRTRYQQLRR